MSEITVTTGRVPIPGGGFGGYGGGGRSGSGSGRSFGSPAAVPFAGSDSLVSLCHQALARLQNAIDTANEACAAHSGLFQTVFDYATGNTSQQSICDAAAQMQIDYDYYSAKVDDSSTTDDQLTEILANINKNTDISDLLDLAKQTDAATVMGQSILNAPGTAVSWVGQGAAEVAKGVAFNIPWWAWVLGAGILANQLGWLRASDFRRKG